MVEKFQSAPALKKAIFEDSYTYYMVCDNDKPIAYCGIQVQKDRLFLSKLYVKKAYRKQGISSWLLKSCIEYAKKHRCHAIYLTCNKYNDGIIIRVFKLLIHRKRKSEKALLWMIIF